MVNIYIEKSPLHVIVRSGLEVYCNTYHRETLGCLYGKNIDKKSGRIYIVENAQPYQEAERMPSNIMVDHHSQGVLELGIENTIGDYHSHTKYSTNNGFRYPCLALGDDDIQDMLKNPENIAVLLTVKKTNRRWPLKLYHDEIYGTILFNNTNYLIHIRAYYLENRRKRIANLMIQKRLLKGIFE